jgi:hypothetical protein
LIVQLFAIQDATEIQLNLELFLIDASMSTVIRKSPNCYFLVAMHP